MLLIMIDDFGYSVVKKKFDVTFSKYSLLMVVIEKLNSVVFHNGLCSKQH
jgi:hypothetical protein